MVTDKKIAKQLNFSRIFLFFTTLNNMYVEGISLGYMEMEILLGLREIKLRVYKRVRVSLYRQWVMN